MIGFLVPARLWPAGDTDERAVAAVMTWDVDEEQPTLDLRLPPDENGDQAIVNVLWSDVVEAFAQLQRQRSRSEDADDARHQLDGSELLTPFEKHRQQEDAGHV